MKTFFLLALIVFLGLSSTIAADSPKPNIVLVLADDLGYGDVKYLNPEGKIATPNMDRLASQGMVFTDAHSSSAVCSPTVTAFSRDATTGAPGLSEVS